MRHAWKTRRRVAFSHCDPAGIVFYPRYFEIVQDAKEEFFLAALGQSYEALFRSEQVGLPIVRLECKFLAPSRHGDLLDIDVVIAGLGDTSMQIDYDISSSGQARASIRTIIVQTRLATGAPIPIKGPLRSAIEKFMGKEMYTGERV